MDRGKSLNDRGGARRYTFKSDAAQAIQLAETVARDVRAPHERALEPERGVAGCFFSEELQRWKELEMGEAYKRLHGRVYPLTRTLASLLHHRDAVAGALAEALAAAGAATGAGSYAPVRALCALVGVLARDLRGALLPAYPALAGALRSVIDGGGPQAGAEAFRALSFVFKYAALELLGGESGDMGGRGANAVAGVVATTNNAGAARLAEWSGYLGARRLVLRDMTAAALALLLRRAPLDAARARLTGALRGLSAAPPAPLSRALLPADVYALAAGAAGAAVRARGVHARDGAARLLFESLRGPLRGLHSRAGALLNAMLEAAAPRAVRVENIMMRAAQEGAQSPMALVTARVTVAVDLYALALAQRGEVVTQAVRYTCAHVSTSHQPALRTVWRALINALTKAIDAFVAGTDVGVSGAALYLPSTPHGAGGDTRATAVADRVTLELQAARAARLGTRPAVTSPQSLGGKGGGAETAASHTLTSSSSSDTTNNNTTTSAFRRCASLYVTQLAGTLLAWSAYRGGAHVPRGGAAGLVNALRRLFSDSVWRARDTAPVLRAVSLRLLLASWLHVAVPRAARSRTPYAGSGRLDRALGTAQRLAAARPMSKRAKKAAASVARRTRESDSEAGSDDEAPPVRGADNAATAAVRSADGDNFARSRRPTTEASGEGAGGGGSDGEEEETDDDGAGDAGAGAAAALAALLLRTVFTPLESTTEETGTDGMTGIDTGAAGVALAVTAASAGLLLAAPSIEGPVFPNTVKCGRNADFRVVAIASLAPRALRLSFARTLLALAAHWGARLRTRGGAATTFHPDAPRATLTALLPPLSGFCETLLSEATVVVGGGVGADTRTDVIWSMLLNARDAIVPRGAGRGDAELVAAVPGAISSSGRLLFGGVLGGGRLARGLLDSLHTLKSVIEVIAASASSSNGILDFETDASLSAALARAYGLVSASAAVAPDAVPAIRALLAIASAATVPLDSSPLTSALGHVRASALLNAARFAADGNVAASEALSTGGIAHEGLEWALSCASFVAPLIDTPRDSPPPAVTRAAALALAALNAASALVDALRTRKGASEDAFLGIAASYAAVGSLLPLFSHRDAALRFAALRLAVSFAPPEASGGSSALSKSTDKSDVGCVHKSLSDAAAGRPARLRILFDDISDIADDRGGSPSLALNIMFACAAAPNTLEHERTTIAALNRLSNLVASGKLPPVHAVACLHYGLGVLFARFLPLHAPARALIAAAATAYPKTTWAAFASALLAAAVDRAPQLDSAARAEAKAEARFESTQLSRSASRAERSSSSVTPLRVGAVAACAAGGAAAGSGGVSGDGASRAGSVMSAAASLVSRASGASNITRAADGGEAAGVIDASAALEAGGPELSFRLTSVLERGLWGADAASVATRTAVSSEGSSMIMSHINDAPALAIGEGGSMDAEVRHSALLTILDEAPDWATGRARQLVAFFLAFVRDDVFGRTHADDPDGAEVDIAGALERLAAVALESEIKATARRVAAGASATMDALAADSAALLIRVVAPSGALASARASLHGGAALARLLSWLRVLEHLPAAAAVEGGVSVRALCERFVGRAEPGLADAALRVLCAWKVPHVAPYRDNFTRLLGDRTFRDELAAFPLASATCRFAPAHRAPALLFMVRLLFGRLLARRGRTGRDSMSSRRAATLAYVAQMDNRESGLVLALAARHFLRALGGAVPRSDSSEALLGFLDGVQRPVESADATRLVAAARSAFAPPDGGSATAAVTAPRAIGFLRLLHDLVRNMGHKLSPHLHIVTAIVIACVVETAAAARSDETATVRGGGGNGEDDDLADEALPGEEDFARAAADDGASVVDAGDGDEATVDEAGGEVEARVTGVAERAKEIRPISMDALSDLLNSYGDEAEGVNVLRTFVPVLASALGKAVETLPSASAFATKPSSIFGLLTTAARHESSLGLLASLPNAVPALFACLSAGLPGASIVFVNHCAAVRVGDAALVIETVDPPQRDATATAHAGPAAPIVAAAFTFLEAFLATAEKAVDSKNGDSRMVGEGDDDDNEGGETARAAVLVHVPFLLHHLFVRLSASSSARALPSAAMASISLSDGDALRALSLKGTNRAFARRTLSLLSRVAALAASARTSLSPDVVERLLLLLLPFLSLRSRTDVTPTDVARESDDPVALVFGIVRALAPHVRAPAAAALFPFFARLLAPGPKTLAASARGAAVGVLTALATASNGLGPISEPLRTLSALTAMSVKRVEELDFDAVLGGLEKLATPANCAALFRPATEGGHAAALPPLLYQALHLLMDNDSAVRTAATNAAGAVVKAAGALVFIDNGSSANFARDATERVLVPALRAALATSSATLRRGVVLLFADMVRAFKGAPGAAHADLAPLTSDGDAETDLFLNLVHVQVHRRARALNRLAAAVRSGDLGEATVRHFCLPMALHALHDDSGKDSALVVSKGRAARLHEKNGSGKGDSSSNSGLHEEAVRLFGAVGSAAPYSLFVTTFRTLLRLANAAPLGPLEKVLVRALTALTEGWHWDLRAPRVSSRPFAMPEAEFVALLGRALSTSGQAARHSKAQALASVKNDGDENDANDDGIVDVDANVNNDHDDVDVDVDDDTNALAPTTTASPVVTDAADDETVRRTYLLDLTSILIPSLEKMLNRVVPGDATEGNNDDGWTRGVGDGIDARGAKIRGPPRGFGELRPHVATALVTLLRQLPQRNYADAYPTLLLKLCAALRSRAESHRETARSTLARVVVALGARDALTPTLDALTNALREGYQLHVLGHAVYAVLEALAPKMLPRAPPADAEPQAMEFMATSAAPPIVESLVNDSGSIGGTSDDASRALVDAIPKIMQILLEEAPSVAGPASGTGADPESGYRPSADLGLKESKSSRTGDSLEILGRCIPFLPSPAIHALLAPMVALLESGRTLSSPRLADAVDSYFRRVLVGLRSNPSVTGPYVMLYVHGVCSDFLGLTTGAAQPRNVSDDEDEASGGDDRDGVDAKAVTEESIVSVTTGGTSLVPANVPAIAAAFEKLQRRIVSSKGGRHQRQVTSWLPGDARTALGLSGTSASGSDVSGAMRQRGAGVTSANADVWRVLPEPRLTGSGRYEAVEAAKINSGARGGGAVGAGLGAFCLSFLLAAISRGRVTSNIPLHVTMLDTFVPLLLEIVERGGGGDARVLLPALRALTAILPYPLPMLRRASTRLVRLVISAVHEHSTAGPSGESRRAKDALGPRSELAHAALRAATVLVRACDYARVPEPALVGLLELARGDMPIAPRQGGALALLRAIVGRRLLAAELYDAMDDAAHLIVRALRPSARAAAAGVFLTFLLRYPMAERVLQRHLNFFLSNLGYAHEDGRLAVIDMLTAVITRFPEPVLDVHSPLIWVTLVARLGADSSRRARAAVGAALGLLVARTSAPASAKLVDMALEWAASGNKVGLRRVGTHCAGLAADSRASLFAGVAGADRVVRLVQSLTTELARAAVNVSTLEAAAAVASGAISSRTVARDDDNEEEEEEEQEGGEETRVSETAGESTHGSLLKIVGSEAGEDTERSLALSQVARASEIAGGDDATTDALYVIMPEEEEGNDAVGVVEASIIAGGGGGRGASVTDAEAAAFAAVEGGSTGGSAAVDLEWETPYYALLAAERLLRAAGTSVEAAVSASAFSASASGGSGIGAGGAKSVPPSTGAAAYYAIAPHGWRPSVRGAAGCPAAAAVDLLTYPHAWVRLAAARLVSTHLSQHSIEGLRADWTGSAHALLALAHRTISTLAVPYLGPALALVATSNLTFATLALADTDVSSLSGLFARATRSAGYRAADAGKAATLRWLAACALRLKGEGLRAIIEPAARLLHRLLDVELAPGQVSDETRGLANEAVELLSAQVGAADIARALNAERARSTSLRANRKAAAAVQRVVDPAGAAAAKARRQASKALGKRKAVDKFRVGKGKKARL